MSLHGNPQCAASAFALHLEATYGLQLDPYRHRQLVAELEEYAGRVDEPARGCFGDYLERHHRELKVLFPNSIQDPVFPGPLVAAPDSTDEPAPSDPAESDESYEASAALQETRNAV